MADETHHKMSEGNPTRLRIIVSALAVVYVMTFLGGFLQDTQYNFFNYILFSLLFVGGIGLMSVTVKSEATGMTRGFLFLTGITTCCSYSLSVTNGSGLTVMEILKLP